MQQVRLLCRGLLERPREDRAPGYLDARTFSRYLDWAYTDRIDLHITDLDAEHAGGPPEPGRARAFTQDTAMQLCRLYVAADMLLDSQLKINIIDDLTALPELASTMSVHCVQYVSQHTASGCGLQNFFLDCAAAYHSKEFIMHCKHTGIFSSDFMSDLKVRLLECRSMKKARYSPVYSRRCVYHDHNDDERGRCTAAQQDA